jgi:hypothetical protein
VSLQFKYRGAARNVAGAFETHKMPEGALPVRCHVVTDGSAERLEDYLVCNLPSCYVTKSHLRERRDSTGCTPGEILANRLPDTGSVMSGDFGEVLTLFFLAAERAENIHLVRKWRYKQDRLKATPHSDVVILHRAELDAASADDFVICAEAKQKATAGKFNPISKAVEGFRADKTGRLARTLVWLREKAIDLETRESIKYIERFTTATNTPYERFFKAVAVVDRELLDDELTREIDLPEQDEAFEMVVLGISDLKRLYETVFSRAAKEISVE